MTTAFDVVLKELEQRRESVSQAINSGAAKDFPEYKSMTGEVRGLSLAHSLIKDLAQKMERSDD
jgi:hypothetical protein